MITYGDFRERLARLLSEDNPATPEDYPPDLLYQVTKSALTAVLPWRWLEKSETYVGDNTTRLFDLPADFYQTIYVVVDDAPLQPARFQFGLKRSTTTNDWLTFAGKLNLAISPKLNIVVDLMYKAHFPTPDDMDDLTFEMPIPTEAIQGMLYYACSAALTPKIIESSDIRRWNDRQDSGTPEDNPIERTFEHFYEMFLEEMKLLPKINYA